MQFEKKHLCLKKKTKNHLCFFFENNYFHITSSKCALRGRTPVWALRWDAVFFWWQLVAIIRAFFHITSSCSRCVEDTWMKWPPKLRSWSPSSTQLGFSRLWEPQARSTQSKAWGPKVKWLSSVDTQDFRGSVQLGHPITDSGEPDGGGKVKDGAHDGLVRGQWGKAILRAWPT